MFLYGLLAIFVLLSIWLLEAHLIKSKKIVENNRNSALAQIPTNDNSAQPTAVQSSSTEQIKSMPIFMYHYIRDYTDQSDPTGVNLSVSPQTFENQLNLIKEKGYNPTTFLDIENKKYPDNPVILSFDDGYEDFYQSAYPILKKYNYKAVLYDIVNFNNENYVNEAQLKEMSNYGIEIGSHTLSHKDLTKITPDKAKQEIEESKKLLEAKLGKEVISFCYPSGKYNDETVNLVKNAGYKYATTTKPGIGNMNNQFELSRYRIQNITDIGKLLKK